MNWTIPMIVFMTLLATGAGLFVCFLLLLLGEFVELAFIGYLDGAVPRRTLRERLKRKVNRR